MRRGFVYFVGVMDWATRRILSWRLSNTLTADFCVEALQEAIERHGAPEIFNTDPGGQFTSDAFTSVLKQHNIQISMDGKGRWIDKLSVERLWRSVKYEEVYLKAYENITHAQKSLAVYFNFYNSERRHQSLDRRTPDSLYYDAVKAVAAATALLATAWAINATLYAATQVSYILAKDGDLPEIYDRRAFENTEGLIISALLIVPMIVFFNISQIAAVASIAVLMIQGFTHVGHLFKRTETGANLWPIMAAVVGSLGAAGFAIAYTSKSMPLIAYYNGGIFFLAFAFEVLLRLFTGRAIGAQIISELENVERKFINRLGI